MKYGTLLICLLALPLWSATSFEAAAAAYDQGNYEKALSLYQGIDGQSAALDYNIGNTLMRLNRPAEATAYYRRALWQRPGDPDISANLERAVKRTQAVIPPLPLSVRLAGFLNPQLWQWCLIGSCWLFAGFGLLQRFIKVLRPVSAWVFPMAGLFILFSLAGVWATRPSQIMREAVIIGESAKTRFEPLPDATEHFSLPAGSVVQVGTQNRNWLRITADGKNGWLEATELLQLKDLP